jgi:hypothetical protein
MDRHTDNIQVFESICDFCVPLQIYRLKSSVLIVIFGDLTHLIFLIILVSSGLSLHCRMISDIQIQSDFNYYFRKLDSACASHTLTNVVLSSFWAPVTRVKNKSASAVWHTATS